MVSYYKISWALCIKMIPVNIAMCSVKAVWYN
jgi:hypothetical protein